MDAKKNFSELLCIEEVLGPQRDPLFIVIPIIVIYLVIFITGMIGNVSTCIVIYRIKSMHTATNYYLFSLAISDLLLLISGLPHEIYLIWSRYPYIFGGTMCFLHGLFAETSANATVCTITAFTVERYLAICYPLRSRTMSKLSRAIKIIFIIWLFAVCTAIPQAVQFGIIKNGDCEICHFVGPIVEHSFEISTIVFFVAPMSLITLLYALIGVKLKSSKMMKKRRNDYARRKSSRKIIKMLVAVVAAFFICWAPFHVQRLFSKYSTGLLNENTHSLYLKVYEIVTYISGILYYVSATINPILYNIMSAKFREAFRETFRKFCCFSCCLQSGMSERTYSILSRSAPTGGVARESTTTDSGCTTSGGGGRNDYNPNERKPDRKGLTIQCERKICIEEDIDVIQQGHNENMSDIYMEKHQNETEVRRCCNFLKCFHKKPDGNLMRNVKKTNFPVEIGNFPKENSLCSCDISDSSLKEMEKEALEDELTIYMKKLQFT